MKNTKVLKMEKDKITDDNIYCNVYASYDYNKFVFSKWNRSINRKKVEKLKESMNECAFNRPILVKKMSYNLKILDGQHSFVARKELNKPILYLIEPSQKPDKEIILPLNINMDKWSLYDYISAYAKEGNQNYINAIAFIEEYQEFRYFRMKLSLIINANDASYDDLREGNLKIHDLKKVKANADILLDLRNMRGFTINKLDLCTNLKFFCAIFRFIKIEDVKINRLKQKLENFPTLFYPCLSSIEYFNMLLKAYNYKQSKNTHLKI
jgi:hypothetical protein